MTVEDNARPVRPASLVPIQRLDLSSFHMRILDDLNYPENSSQISEVVHRHDFHEIIWIESGTGFQNIDGEICHVKPHAFYLIARGQVHHFTEARQVCGLVIRFNEDFLPDPRDKAERLPGLLFDPARSARLLEVGSDDVPRLQALMKLLVDEYRYSEEGGGSVALGHLMQALIINLERIAPKPGDAPSDSNDADNTTCSNFVALLGQHYRKHHDVGYYADILSCPPRQLSIHVKRATGKTAKALIEDRLILEAKRNLRFTTLSIKEIAYELGYADPSYFSKAFKRVTGTTPQKFKPD